MAHVAEKGGLRGVELSELDVRVAELAIGCGQLLAALDDLPFHGLRLVTQHLAELGRLDQVGDVFDPMQDVEHFAGAGEDRDVLWAPVLRLERAVWAADVITLHGHRVGCTRRQRSLERCPEVARTGGLGIVRVVWEDLEERPTHRLLSRGLGRGQACVRRRDHRESRRVWEKYQENVRRRLEQQAEIGSDRIARCCSRIVDFTHRWSPRGLVCGTGKHLSVRLSGTLLASWGGSGTGGVVPMKALNPC